MAVLVLGGVVLFLVIAFAVPAPRHWRGGVGDASGGSGSGWFGDAGGGECSPGAGDFGGGGGGGGGDGGGGAGC